MTEKPMEIQCTQCVFLEGYSPKVTKVSTYYLVIYPQGVLSSNY